MPWQPCEPAATALLGRGWGLAADDRAERFDDHAQDANAQSDPERDQINRE